MKVFWSPLYRLHAPPLYLADGTIRKCPECPERVEYIRDAVAGAKMEVVAVEGVDVRGAIAAVHAGDYLAYLENIHGAWVREFGAEGSPVVLPDTFPRVIRGPGMAGEKRGRRPAKASAQAGYYCFDMAAPIVAGTWEAVVGSAQCAVAAADAGLGAGMEKPGFGAYALCRPPGHHAGRDYCGGFCFLNNAAIAAQRLVEGLRTMGRKGRVAILDVDYHQGNGTQDIFYERDDVLFVSIHADPDEQYPYFWGYAEETGVGAGEGYTLNLPLPRGCSEEAWFGALEVGIKRVREFGAEALVVSLGVDTSKVDVVGDFNITHAGFRRMGERIGGLMRGVGPTVFVQEGGYELGDIGVSVVEVLRGFEG